MREEFPTVQVTLFILISILSLLFVIATALRSFRIKKEPSLQSDATIAKDKEYIAALEHQTKAYERLLDDQADRIKLLESGKK